MEVRLHRTTGALRQEIMDHHLKATGMIWNILSRNGADGAIDRKVILRKDIHHKEDPHHSLGMEADMVLHLHILRGQLVKATSR